jgi:hypothetical protein
VLACVLAAFSFRHAPALAAPTESGDARELARALADEGANAYAEADYQRALALFGRAYELVAAPTIALLEARTLVRLGRWVEARAAYLRAAGANLTPDSPPPFREATRTAIAELAALTPRIPRVEVELSADSKRYPALSVWLDDRRLSDEQLRRFVYVDPGRHSVELRGPGVKPAPVAFVLGEGQLKVVPIEVHSEPVADPQRTWGYVSLGTGAVGLVAGVTTGVLALNAHAEAERECPNNVCERGGAGEAALERFRTFRAISTVGYVLGAVGVGAGVSLLVFRPSESGPQLTVRTSFRDVSVEGRW